MLCVHGTVFSPEIKGRINAFLRRMHQYGFCQFVVDFQEMSEDYDHGLY